MKGIARPDGRGFRWATGALAGAFLLSASVVAAWSSERVALVIGNAEYHDPNAKLRNPGNDADGMAAALGRLGFEVVLGKDLDTGEFDAKVDEFATAARAADVTLFFYAGHGLQVEGTNWLMPVDAKLNKKRDLERTAVRLDAVMESMGGTKKLVFLDACRTNPLARGLARSMGLSRSAAAGRGLARVESAPGTLVVYATEADDVASDGASVNSPFTEALLAHIETPGLDVFAMIDEVAQSVFKATNEAQRPSIQSLPMGLGSFHLASTDLPPPPPNDAAKLAYEAAKEVGTVAAFKIIIEDFPGNTYAKLAKERVSELERATREAEASQRFSKLLARQVSEYSGLAENCKMLFGMEPDFWELQAKRVLKQGREIFGGEEFVTLLEGVNSSKKADLERRGFVRWCLMAESSLRADDMPTGLTGPSYECSKAAKSTEHAICSSKDLWAMDRAMANWYFYLRENSTANRSQELLTSQRDWLQQRNVCGSSVDCLMERYSLRLFDFGG